jgi:hypothetical protein
MKATKGNVKKIKSAFGIWPMAFSLGDSRVLKFLIQIKYNIKAEI